MQGGIYFVKPEQLMGDKIAFVIIAWFGTFVTELVAVGANEVMADYDPQIPRAAKESPKNF